MIIAHAVVQVRDKMATFNEVPVINIAAALSGKDLQQKLAQHLKDDAVKEILNKLSESKTLDSMLTPTFLQMSIVLGVETFNNLKVMDASAIALARDNNLPIIVFSLDEPGGLASVVQGGGKFTIVSNDASK